MDVEYDFPWFYSGVVERDNTRARVKIVNARRGDTRGGERNPSGWRFQVRWRIFLAL